VALDGGDVEVFGVRGEEGHGWGVDAGEERSASAARMTVCGTVAIDAV